MLTVNIYCLKIIAHRQEKCSDTSQRTSEVASKYRIHIQNETDPSLRNISQLSTSLYVTGFTAMTSTVKRVTEWLLKSLKFSRPAYVFVGLLKVSLIWILLLMDSFMKIKLRMSGHVQDN